MSKVRLIAGTGGLVFFALIFVFSRSTVPFKLAGGPEGGTFILFADAIAEQLRAENPDLKIEVISSGGSVANLRMVEAGKVAMALAYLGMQGQLDSKTGRLKNSGGGVACCDSDCQGGYKNNEQI